MKVCFIYLKENNSLAFYDTICKVSTLVISSSEVRIVQHVVTFWKKKGSGMKLKFNFTSIPWLIGESVPRDYCGNMT